MAAAPRQAGGGDAEIPLPTPLPLTLAMIWKRQAGPPAIPSRGTIATLPSPDALFLMNS